MNMDSVTDKFTRQTRSLIERGLNADKAGLTPYYTYQEVKLLMQRIDQLTADLKGQVAAKHQLGRIASMMRDEQLAEIKRQDEAAA